MFGAGFSLSHHPTSWSTQRRYREGFTEEEEHNLDLEGRWVALPRAWVALEEGLGFPVPVLDSSVALLTEPLAPRCRHLSPLLSAPFLSSWPGAGTKELLERWMRPTSPQPLKIWLRILRELLKHLALIRNSAYMSFLLPFFCWWMTLWRVCAWLQSLRATQPPGPIGMAPGSHL